MTQRVGLLNGTNITYDKDFSASALATFNDGVIEGLGISGSGASANVLVGKALIECIRTNGEKVMVFFENTANVVVDLTGTKKLYIQINQGKLDNGSSNALDGTGIGAITTGASYPASNYIPLASITGGVITDAREFLSAKALLAKGYAIGYHKVIDETTGNEVLKPVTTTGAFSPTDIIRIKTASGDFEDIPYSAILSDMSGASGSSTTITPYESTIIANDIVGITEDGLFECQTENGSSVNITGSTITSILGQANIDATRTLFLYAVGTSTFACVGTITNNTMAYGTPVTVATISTSNWSGACCLVDTDKVAIVVGETTTQVIHNRIATIAGNVITFGTDYTHSVSAGGGLASIITGCVKVRTTAYAFSVKTPTGFYNATFVQTLSGTVVTTNNTAINPTPAGNASVFSSQNVIQLANNRIAMMMYNNNAGTDFRAFVFDVNPAGTTASTTYTFSGDLGGQVSGAWLTRLNDTEFVATFGSIVQSVDKFSISGGSLLRTTAFVASLGSFYPTVEISTGYFGVVIGTTINVYNIKGTLVGTISGITALPYNHSIKMRNARFLYLNGANGTTRIINFARVFKAGVATSSVGGVKFFGVQAFTGVLPNQLYYIQDNGTIGTTVSLYPIGKGIAINTLLIG